MPVQEFTLKAIFEAEDRLSKKIDAIEQKLSTLGKATTQSESRLSKLGNIFREIGRQAMGMFTALIGYDIFYRLSSAVEESIQAFAEFEAASVKLAAVSAEAWENIGTTAAYYRAEAAAAAREFAVTGREALAAMEALIKAGLSGSDAAQALGAAIRMAKLEGIDFATAANNLVQVMAQFGIQGSEAARVVDALVNASRLGIGTASDFAKGLANCGATARALGLSLEDTTTWLVILERRFGSAQEAGTHLNRFFLELYEIAEKLGVPIRDVNGALRDVNQVILDVVNAARALGGDFKSLEERLTGVDMRALKTLFTFTQMGENFEFLREEIAKMGTAMQAYNEYLQTMQGQMARTQSEIDAMQRRTGAFFGNLWLQIQSVGLPALEAMGTAFSGIAARITGDAIPALESWLNAQRMMGRLTKEEIADMLADWAQAGEVILSTGEKVRVTTQDIATMAEHLGVMNDRLREVLTDPMKQLDEFFTHLKETGKLTRDVFEGMIAAALMSGKIVGDQARELAEKYGFLDDRMEKVIETFTEMGEKSQELGDRLRITGEAIVDIGRKFDLEAEKAIEVANRVLDLNLVYDEHDRLIKQLTQDYGLSEDQARQLIEAMEEEAEKAKAAAEAQKAHAEALNKLQSALSRVAEYGMVLGPFHQAIQDINEAIAVLGSETPPNIQNLLSTLQELNNQFVQLEVASKNIAAAQNVVSVGLSYFNTLQSIQNALIADEIALHEQRLAQLEEELEKEEAKKHADENRIKRLREQIELEKQHIENLKQSAALTVEQTVSQQRLVAIQQTLGLVSQVVGLQQTAMQLAMMGANNAADMFTGTAEELTKALEDGTVTEQEMKDILEKLGVTFDETGKPVINLKNIMEEFRQKMEETKNKVQDFRSALTSLDGLTVHTYHYHHKITVYGTKGEVPTPEEEAEKWTRLYGGEEWPEYWYGGGPPPRAQLGAWFTREGLYYLHRGEMILPRKVAEWFRRGGWLRLRGGAEGSRNVSINAPVKIEVHGSVYGEDLENLSEEISRRIVRRLRVMS